MPIRFAGLAAAALAMLTFGPAPAALAQRAPDPAGMLGFGALVLLLSLRSLFRKEDWRRRDRLGAAEEG